MRPSSIKLINKNIFNNLLKPSCINCKYFLEYPYAISDNNLLVKSKCRKFLIKPKDNIQTYEWVEVNNYPYAILARFDTNMCNLDGKYFKSIR
jgi:hypothetical protein